MKRKYLWLAGGLFLAGTVVSVLLYPGAVPKPIQASPAGVSLGFNESELEKWREVIRKEGGTKAYEEIVQLAKGADSSESHRLGHLFGQALFEELGVVGFSACGKDLNGGCLHEFIGRALPAQGISIVANLNKICVDRDGPLGAVSCQHGIGHGLLSYYGYTTSGMLDSLKVCATIPTANETLGCYGGVFMEYNLRTMANNQFRMFDAHSPYAPCDTIRAKYKSACYFWLPQWKLTADFGSVRDEKAFVDVGSYCADIMTVKERAACFAGIGYGVPPFVEFDSVRAQALCIATSPIKTDQDNCWKVAQEGPGSKQTESP